MEDQRGSGPAIRFGTARSSVGVTAYPRNVSSVWLKNEREAPGAVVVRQNYGPPKAASDFAKIVHSHAGNHSVSV